MKPIRFSTHAKGRLTIRGVSEEEVIQAILTSDWHPAELGKLECRKTYIYSNFWHGKFYKYKQVRPIFIEEEEEIVVITVYSYFFNEVKP
jgi:hypothetical protein